jgi:Uma2 family endonuclease
MEARDLRRMSLEEYVAFERSRPERWEYVDGEAFAMAGASPRHNAIVMNLTLALGAALRGKPCFPLGSDQKVATVVTRGFHYPDLTVVCGKPRFAEADPHALVNPTVLFEVLSDSTADYDRGKKLDHYATIPELREVVLVFSDTRRIEHRKRVAAEQWLVTHYVGGSVPLEALDTALGVDDVYADLDRVREA